MSSVFAPSSSLSTLPTYSNSSKSRLQSLYSDISRQKHSNPTSYHSNVEWWRRTLETLVSKGWQSESIEIRVTSSSRFEDNPFEDEEREINKLVLSANRSLVERLRYEGVGKPLGLGAVITELRNTKAIIPITRFTNTTQSVYHSGSLPYRIASYVVGKPLWWALEQLELVQPEDNYSESELWEKVAGKYVVMSLVENAADAVVKLREGRAVGPADGLFDFEGFRKEFAAGVNAGSSLSEVDMKVLLKYLERDRKIVVVDKEVIKFVDMKQSPEITAVDRGILELKNAVQNLQTQIDSVQRKIDSCTEKIASELWQKRQRVALSYLKSKKQLEDLLAKRLGSLEVLQSTLIRVEAAAGDVEIVKSYESSTATLRAILSHPSLQRDKIDETMDAMATAAADAKEVDEAIRMGGDMAVAEAGIDESELEDELRALVYESEREKEREEKISGLAAERMKVPEGLADVEQTPNASKDKEPEHSRPIPVATT